MRLHPWHGSAVSRRAGRVVTARLWWVTAGHAHPDHQQSIRFRLGHVALVARLDECGWAAFGSGLGSGGCSNTSSPGTDLTDARLMRQIRDFLEHIDRAAGFLTRRPHRPR